MTLMLLAIFGLSFTRNFEGSSCDRGSQYASHAFQARLKEYGLICFDESQGDLLG